MAKETEIKLRVSPATLDALREHPLLNARRSGDWQSGTLYNQYFDTIDRDLARAKVALRIRRDGDTYIQTLKSRGQSVAGLSERNEWDWYLESDKLDLSRLDDECWPASLADLDRATVEPLFTTHFQRTKVLLGWEREGQQVQVEAALDSGTVETQGGQEVICELELEVREGPAATVLELALQLAQDLSLMPCDISKAERGYRLLDPASYSLRPAMTAWHAESSVDEIIGGAGWQLLGHIQRLAEQFRHTGQFKLFRDMTVALGELRAMFGVFDLGLPRSTAQPFLPTLDELLATFRPLVLAGWADDEAGQAARDQAPKIFAAAVANPAWGQLFVGLALWLHTAAWTVERPPRGDRVGALALPRWLLGATARDIQELQVPHHNEPDAAVSEWMDQMPRLGRLHFLLGHFRQWLDVPEPDRLYGELNKLQALLEQYPLIDAEQQPALLAALRKQGQRLRKLNAWRELNS
ncbi:Inorganic triphosphatase YgiF, contains CYTH and CHAD domains [Halopseudomonas xinjiangensis]|uniref:Inorganic triphosphatase YgiF, contains CYTH and CHAD domains n=1 Tax=Halopseudomonas xinjiangensis TaxID=487184 RepID=A0A1H1LCU2_9GAMM|nr:CYTH domain-containing protein [Halopseudomonas xinjiangensis]SDR72411.1 Inorganic triphosphatase YgiF, contains CYTH and CHAD domains [Halopseudomonas xinjiangensis]